MCNVHNYMTELLIGTNRFSLNRLHHISIEFNTNKYNLRNKSYFF